MRKVLSRLSIPPAAAPVPDPGPSSGPWWALACERDGVALCLEGHPPYLTKAEAQAVADDLNRRDDYLATVSAVLEVHMAIWLLEQERTEGAKRKGGEATAVAYLAEQNRELGRLRVPPEDCDAVIDYVDDLPRFTVIQIDEPMAAAGIRAA